MNLHEYQGKEWLKHYGIDTGPQVLCHRPEEARRAWQQFGGRVVIKAQVLSGGRGKAGGVKVASSADEAFQKAQEILALTIKDIPVEKVLVVPAAAIAKEFYVGITLDRFNKSILLMMSAEGGTEIEELAVTAPDKIVMFRIRADKGIDHKALDEVLLQIFGKEHPAGLPSHQQQAKNIIERMYKLFLDKDATLVEVNPMALLEDGRIVALDAKVSFDDNALYAHKDVEAMRNPEDNSADEIAAREAGLSFVSMDGHIGCIVNGAGLAMATMDIVKLFGGEPANFLDVGGSSNPNKVVAAIKIIMGNPKVRGIFLNIFGGITRCDDVANGLLLALDQVKVDVPLVVRLIGTNDQEGRDILQKRGISAYTDLNEAVQKIVALADKAPATASKAGGTR